MVDRAANHLSRYFEQGLVECVVEEPLFRLGSNTIPASTEKAILGEWLAGDLGVPHPVRALTSRIARGLQSGHYHAQAS
jgi:hypothetical protein